MNRIANQVTRLLSAFPGEGDEAVTAAVAAARPSIGGASDERLEGRAGVPRRLRRRRRRKEWSADDRYRPAGVGSAALPRQMALPR